MPDEQQTPQGVDAVDADHDTIEPVRMQALDPEYDRITASGAPIPDSHYVELAETEHEEP